MALDRFAITGFLACFGTAVYVHGQTNGEMLDRTGEGEQSVFMGTDQHVTLAMSRFHSLAAHTGFETPEGPEFASERGSRIHGMLAEWEARVTGQEYVSPPQGKGEPSGGVARK